MRTLTYSTSSPPPASCSNPETEVSTCSRVTYTYDENGNVLTRDDDNGTTTFTYDLMNRVKTKTATGSSITYTYDSASNLKTLSHQSQGNQPITYTYNDINQIKTLVEPDGDTTTFSYTPATERLKTTTYPNGVTLNRTYDDSGRLDTVVGKGPGGAVLSSFDYDYTDDLGFDTALRQKVTTPSGTIDYDYDKLNRIKKADYPGGTTNDVTYAYDANSNLKSRTQGSSTVSATINDSNELTSFGSTAFTYDSAGNNKSKGSTTFTYNMKGQNSRVMEGGVIPHTLQYSDATQEERVAFDQSRFEYSSLGLTQQTTPVTRSYLRDDKGRLVGATTAGNNGPVDNYYLFDGVGSVVGVTNDAGQKIRSYEYDPYGRILSNTGSETISNPWRFASGFFDTATGYTKFGVRYYDAEIGRFSQVDPMLGVLTNPVTLNPYQYAGDDPVNNSDPTGRSHIECTDTNSPYCASDYGDALRIIGEFAIGCVPTGTFLAELFAPTLLGSILAAAGGCVAGGLASVAGWSGL